MTPKSDKDCGVQKGTSSLESREPANPVPKSAAAAPKSAGRNDPQASLNNSRPDAPKNEVQLFETPLYFAWALTAFGWYATHSLAARREERKEKRTEVDACCKMVAELLAKARTYYLEKPDSEKARQLAPEIRFEVQRLCKRIERLEKRSPGFSMATSLDGILDTVTGGYFESANRSPEVPNSAVLMSVEQACHLVIDSLENGFSAAYDDGFFIRFKKRLGGAKKQPG